MFFKWAVHTRQRWLQRVIYWAQAPVVAGLGYGMMRVLAAIGRWLIPAMASPWVLRSFILTLFPGVVILCVVLLNKLFRYRTGDLVLASLNFCPEDVHSPQLNLRRGTLVVELHQGEFYNFAKYWPLRLSLTELVPFAFLDSYTAVINLIEQIKSGRAPLNGSTPLMTTTIFLSAADHIPAVYVAEEVKREKTFLYRVAMALSLRMNPFSSRIPAPRSGSRRVYLPAQALVDHEPFFRDEVAKLSKLTQRILERKRRQQVNNRAPLNR